VQYIHLNLGVIKSMNYDQIACLHSVLIASLAAVAQHKTIINFLLIIG